MSVTTERHRDLMSLDRLPGLAEVAMQSSHHAARTTARRLRGGPGERPFRYRDLGTMATNRPPPRGRLPRPPSASRG